MGTQLVSASISLLGIKTIIGGVITLVMLLVFYNLFRSNKTMKTVVFAVVCGVIAISTLILLSLAFTTAINEGSWL